MTIAVCYSCGAMKFGALAPCETCRIMPSSEGDIIASLVMTDRHFPISELENISQAIKKGDGPLNIEEKTKAYYRPAAREAQRMLGLAPSRAAQGKPTLLDWFSKRRFGLARILGITAGVGVAFYLQNALGMPRLWALAWGVIVYFIVPVLWGLLLGLWERAAGRLRL